MGAEAHHYTSTDDDFLKALGLEPNKYPSKISIAELLKNNANKETLNIINTQNLQEVYKNFTLKERLLQAGISALKETNIEVDWMTGSFTREFKLSNGKILKEVRDEKKEKDIWKKNDWLTAGYDFVFAYKVIVE